MFFVKPPQFYLILLFFFQLGFAQKDCSDAIIVCGNSNFDNLSATGAGVQELTGTNDCNSEENNSLWLKVTIAGGGTLGFTLTPENSNINEDYDFFIYGPNPTCGNIGHAIRCSTTNPQAASQGNNLTGLSQNEFDTSEGPGADGNSFVAWLDVEAGESYFIVIDRPIGNSNFSLQWTGTATFSIPPTVNNPVGGSTFSLSKCDSDNLQDDSTVFNLSGLSATAIGLQSDITTTFHTTIDGAITNSGQILDPSNFTNTSNPQTVYIRLTNDLTGCFATSEVILDVTPFNTNTPNDLEECDLDNDGFVTFNLTQNTALLNGGDPNITVSYYPNTNSTVVLPNSYTNTTAFTTTTVWAKIADNSGCFVYKPFDLIVNRLPAKIPSQLTQCDFQLSPDGLTTFNLAQANDLLTASNPDYSTKFYLTASDAQTDTGALSNSFANTQNPQTLYARVIDNTTQCFSITTLTLNVSVNPTVTVTLEKCDDATEDGLTQFVLSDAGFEISGNTVVYYPSANDALLETNPLPGNYTNTTPAFQRIYARIENANNCIGINIIDLKINPLPNIIKNDNAVFCLNKPNEPVTLDAGIGTQNPNQFTYLWTPNGETTPTIDAYAAGTYTVKVSNSQNCSKTRTIIVKESDLAVIEAIDVVLFTDNNAITIFVQGDESDYLYSIEDLNGFFQESNHFEHLFPGIQYAYVKDKDGCGTTRKEFTVLGAPAFFTPNGDGYNDTWKITGMDNGYFSNSIIYIYNRFGKLIKQMTGSSDGWDGTFGGELLPATDYWYVIQLEDGRSSKGHFSLKR
ncbi:T9SS type B sorting domain-containing protein [Flavobacterium sp. SM15]|uniref:T9SS type B sorting domain-containing protein n=1 Tax=Flavobacterium sp. SM15 TaxID=2908005 RepID=UPI001EDAD7AA|nr:T9SS type B sorting domain-containing protein [Flavobacterium sp. SM15]MCG2611069.1 T9SS type B sorting domain-containing protein [Flavobacterium sp. SM15]